MDISINTPALLFPAMSLILLAYTNRFNTLAQLIRSLHARYLETHDREILEQIHNLRLRTRLIRDMQGLGIVSMFLCVLAMFLIYAGSREAGIYAFAASLLVLMASLALTLWEIWISTRALMVVIRDIEEELPRSPGFSTRPLRKVAASAQPLSKP